MCYDHCSLNIMKYWPGPTFCDAGNACFCLGPAGLDKMAASHVIQRQLHGPSGQYWGGRRPIDITPPASTNIFIKIAVQPVRLDTTNTNNRKELLPLFFQLK